MGIVGQSKRAVFNMEDDVDEDDMLTKVDRIRGGVEFGNLRARTGAAR